MAETRPRISLIVARARDGAIGRRGDLPWHVPADLRHFKRLTVGKPVIMGRKTFESIAARLGGPLPGRHNIVVTRNSAWNHPGVSVAANLAEAIASAGLDPKSRAPEIMVIGGAEIYAQALLFADRLYVTEIDLDIPDADAHFAPLEAARWIETARETHAEANGLPGHAFVTLDRR